MIFLPHLTRALLWGLVLISFSIQAQEKEFDPNEEERGAHFEIDELGELFLGFKNKAYADISEKLFDRISTYDVGIRVGDFTTVVGQVRRKVYDNKDGTYSVLDVFGVKGVVSPGANLDVAGIPLYGVIGAEVGVDFINIRQVDHKLKIGYAPSVLVPEDPWFVDLWEGAQARWFGARYLYDFANGLFNIPFELFRSPSDQSQPRYKDVLNVIRTPFRLPLSVELFNDMDPGEIMSYTLLGGRFMSVGAGWVRTLLGAEFSANVGLTLYKRGASRITILKERNGQFAKIKVSDIHGDGTSLGAKIRGQVDLIEGVIFGSDLSASLVPFRIAVDNSDIVTTDTLYRYDMSTAEGVLAYEKAVIGDFSFSQEETAPIETLYHKKTDTDRLGFERGYNLIIWKHLRNATLDNSLITVTDEDGVSHVFKSVSRNQIKTGNIFQGKQESIDYFIDTTFEMDAPLEAKESRDPVVQVALFITDHHAYGYQIRQYFSTIEHLLQNPQYFDEGQFKLQEDYGKMSAQFEVHFYLEAIEKILDVPENELWKAIAQAHGIKPSAWDTPQKREAWVTFGTYVAGFLRVRSAIERIRILKEAQTLAAYFRDIQKETPQKKRAALVSDFHHKNGFETKMLTVMLLLAPSEDLGYELKVAGKRVPQIHQKWGKEIPIERPDLHETEEKEMEGRPVITRARISELRISYSEADQKAFLQFKTDVDASTLEGFYFRIHRIRGWWFRNETLYQTSSDRDIFKEFKVDDNGVVSVPLENLPLLKSFEEGKRYELSFAFRQNNQVFSIEPKLIFTFEHKNPMDIHWIDIYGKSEMK